MEYEYELCEKSMDVALKSIRSTLEVSFKDYGTPKSTPDWHYLELPSEPSAMPLIMLPFTPKVTTEAVRSQLFFLEKPFIKLVRHYVY